MEVVALSPHRDDAAFSCGLLLSALQSAGARVRVVNVCTISSYAPYLEASGTNRVQQVTSARRQEDEAFAALLTAWNPMQAVEFLDLQWKDAPLRWDIEEEQVLAPHPLRAQELLTLRKELQGLPQANIVLAPLGLGGHLDHRVVHEAARTTFTASMLMFYEDLPYACRLTPSEGAADRSKTGFYGQEFLLPPPSTPDAKREYALCYPSQVAAEVADELKSYAAQLGGRERYYGQAEAFEWLNDVLRRKETAKCA